jgi:hypothetical protein
VEFNNDPEWLRQRAAAEDNCDVSVGERTTITTGHISWDMVARPKSPLDPCLTILREPETE